MELLQLRYFFESAKSESFTKTAEKFLVPPSSVSASVKRLEKELGCTLFYRNANRIVLSEKGKQLQKAVCGVFDELEHFAAELCAQDCDNTEVSILVRSMRGSITNKIIEFHKEYPSVRFNMSFDLSEKNYDDYDIIIDEASENYCDFERFELCSLKVGIRAAADNPLCNRPLRLSQLRNENFICIDEQSNLFQILLKACSKAGFSPNIIMKTNDAICYTKCLESGMGLAASRHYTNNDSKNSKTVFLQITDFDERQTIYVYHTKQKNRSNVQNFVKFLKNSI